MLLFCPNAENAQWKRLLNRKAEKQKRETNEICIQHFKGLKSPLPSGDSFTRKCKVLGNGSAFHIKLLMISLCLWHLCSWQRPGDEGFIPATFLKQPGPTHPFFQGGGEYLPGVLQELVDHYGRCPAVHVKVPPSAKNFRSSEDFFFKDAELLSQQFLGTRRAMLLLELFRIPAHWLNRAVQHLGAPVIFKHHVLSPNTSWAMISHVWVHNIQNPSCQTVLLAMLNCCGSQRYKW